VVEKEVESWLEMICQQFGDLWFAGCFSKKNDMLLD
jgi:hypothetical protein